MIPDYWWQAREEQISLRANGRSFNADLMIRGRMMSLSETDKHAGHILLFVCISNPSFLLFKKEDIDSQHIPSGLVIQ